MLGPDSNSTGIKIETHIRRKDAHRETGNGGKRKRGKYVGEKQTSTEGEIARKA